MDEQKANVVLLFCRNKSKICTTVFLLKGRQKMLVFRIQRVDAPLTYTEKIILVSVTWLHYNDTGQILLDVINNRYHIL